MFPLSQEDQDVTLDKLREYAKARGLKIGVFGSYARGEATLNSDMDLMLESDDISLLEAMSVSYDLTFLAKTKVDLVISRLADDYTVSRIKKDGVQLW